MKILMFVFVTLSISSTSIAQEVNEADQKESQLEPLITLDGECLGNNGCQAECNFLDSAGTPTNISTVIGKSESEIHWVIARSDLSVLGVYGVQGGVFAKNIISCKVEPF